MPAIANCASPARKIRTHSKPFTLNHSDVDAVALRMPQKAGQLTAATTDDETEWVAHTRRWVTTDWAVGGAGGVNLYAIIKSNAFLSWAQMTAINFG